jgi:exodeoxyribonuclease VII large subunit
LRFLTERTLARELMQRMRDSQQQLDLAVESLRRKAKQFVADTRAEVANRAQSLKAHEPRRELALCRNRTADLQRRIAAQLARLLTTARQRFQRVEEVLRVLGPEATLRRGYSITTNAAGKVIATVEAAPRKSKIRTRVADGEFESQVL